MSQRAMTNYLERTLLTDGHTRFLTDDEMAELANACQACGKQLDANNPHSYCDITCKRAGHYAATRRLHNEAHTTHPNVYRPNCHGC